MTQNTEQHDSDCAMHNEPAFPNGPCDCRLSQNTEQNVRTRDEQAQWMVRCIRASGDHPSIEGFLREHIRIAEARGAAEEQAKSAGGKPIHIVFSGEPGPDTLHFVEVEDGHGSSIRIGEWEKRPDGLMELVIPTYAPANIAALKVDATRYRIVRQRFLEDARNQGEILTADQFDAKVDGDVEARAALTREGGV